MASNALAAESSATRPTFPLNEELEAPLFLSIVARVVTTLASVLKSTEITKYVYNPIATIEEVKQV